jgi:SAM-dependent methyltransferase
MSAGAVSIDPVPPAAMSTGPPTLRLHRGSAVIPLGFSEDASAVYLVARERSARWPVDLLRDGLADLELPSGRIQGRTELVIDPPERARILELFRVQYGAERFERYYDHPARVLRVLRGGDGPLPPAERYYRWLESEFDQVASDYDRHITGNRMNRLLRDRSLARLRAMFSKPTSLIEIGCGSGMETLPMLRAGHEVIAVDISEKMLEVVRTKAVAEGSSERLRTVRCRAADLGGVPAASFEVALQGGYSTYGALNCEPELAPVARALAKLIPPGGRFLAGVYNRWCLFELAGYGLTLQPRRALSRRERPVPVGSSRFCIDSYAYSVSQVRDAFGPAFRPEGLEGVPVLLPPSDLTRYAERFARHFETLARVDAALGSAFPLTYLGDHFLLQLRRSGGPA